MMNCLKNTGWTVDVVTPVPVSSSRKTTRGYNQAALLARPIALYFGLAYCPGALAKKRDTRSQVGLTADQRLENVRDAFKAAEGIVKEKRVLVIDDVTTSGATLSSCSHALFDAGAEKVYCLTLARAL
jgi:ComF family protein